MGSSILVWVAVWFVSNSSSSMTKESHATTKPKEEVMTKADEKLISTIAYLWVNNGGDSTGFEYCYQDILETIKFYEKQELMKP